MEKNKIKVVWLCHFANEEMKQYFGTPLVNEFASWMGKMLDLFRQNSEVEIHVVAPNVFTNTNIKFTKNGISYNFYQIVPSMFKGTFLNKLYHFARLDYYSSFYWISRKVSIIIKELEPNIIHLHGAENPYYSAAILPIIHQYPVLTTIQGFIRNSTYLNFDIRRRISIEEKILKYSKNIGIRASEMVRIVNELNANASLHFHNYPLDIPDVFKSNIGDSNEVIDCIFFARIEKDKGIEDLLKAASILISQGLNINLMIIGDCGDGYMKTLKLLISTLCIDANVSFVGFLPSQTDLYPYILKSKLCILPTYHDIIPGTILLSMFMKLPVISYNVGGIPDLNRNGKTVTLVEKGDIIQLANEIKEFILNVSKRSEIANKAFYYSRKRFDNNNVVTDILRAYKQILGNNNISDTKKF